MLSKIYFFIKFFLYFLYKLPRDIRGAFIYRRIKSKVKECDTKNYAVQDIFTKWVKEQPNKPCIIFNDEIYTYSDLELESNKIANLFSEKFQLKKGDCVALFMENKPQFVSIWYGLGKLGVITALINTNLRHKSLIHCIQVAKPKIIIYDTELERAISEVQDELKIDLIKHGEIKTELNQNVPRLENLIKDFSDLFSPKEKITGSDILMYIYTSGTTGLPKPAIIKHGRYVAGGFSFFDSARLTKDDIFYVTLPIYHSNAGILGLGAGLISGATVILRKKFSASNFWKDAIKYNCTAFSYVGEICRYLLNQPPSDLDKKHKIKLCFGNGTRDYISKDFLDRFGVKCLEIYGATEGNVVLVNTVGKHGACGYIPIINRYFQLLPYYLIKVDDALNPIRDEKGFCIQCLPGEKGLIVGILGKSIKSEFSGYANSSEATNKKLIENLFYKGQRAFNTGDVLVQDWQGYVYFVDRLGDTFRWKGENVSTLEIEDAVSRRLNSIEVACYGVSIPGQEGKCGMVSIITQSDIDLKKLDEHLKNDLPAYARPLFIRLTSSVEHTGSLKAVKKQLILDGYNVTAYNDKTFYYNTKEQAFKELTKELYDQIQLGLFKF
ncbi:unnamed protein product [Brachionus calyciflorus]|uniref:Very long-chain fatty acid transport protein n=1 Tax=Brachionus calyciflorus TaxID=104777 RepID=A0A813M7Q3_9BILA|nr:unnamed protein product [Brachionus calyciflorus]